MKTKEEIVKLVESLKIMLEPNIISANIAEKILEIVAKPQPNWISVEDEETAREPIEDALLAMKIVEPDAIPEVAQNILSYIKDADFCIAKQAPELPKEG